MTRLEFGTHVRRREMYCVGLEECVKQNKVFLLMVDEAKKKSSESLRVIRLLLNHQSAPLISPFYRHRIQIRLIEEGSLRAEYELEEWSGTEFRIGKKKSEKTFADAVRNVVRNSFFPLMIKTLQIRDWQREYFCWDTFHRGMSVKYHEDFCLEDWIGPGKGLGKKEYWESFRKEYKYLLDPLLKSMEINKDTMVENNMSHLHEVFNQWKTQAHITGYFRHRLLEMTQLQTLHQQRLTRILTLSTLPRVDILDLFQLHDWLTQLGARGVEGENILEKALPRFRNQTHLLTVTLRNVFVPFLKHHLLHKKALENFTKRDIRRLIVRRLFVPVLMASLESNASLSKSTVIPVYRKCISYWYVRIFSVTQTPHKKDADTDASSRESSSEEGEEEYRGDLMDFEESHRNEVLAYCREAIDEKVDGVKWRVSVKSEPPQQENTPLYFITTKPDAIQLEERMREIWCQGLEPSEHRIVSIDFSVEEWQNRYLFMDDVDRGLYQIRLTTLPITLKEMKEERDLSVLKDLLSANIYEAGVVRPGQSEFTKSRLVEYFRRESERGTSQGISVKDLNRRLKTVQSLTMNTGTVMPLLVLMDCHFFSVKELHTLLRFVERRKTEIKRIFLIGALDLLPLDSDGNAFLDLIQWREPGFLRTKIFQFSLLRKESQLVLDDMKASGQIKFLYEHQLDSTKESLPNTTSIITISKNVPHQNGKKCATLQELAKFTGREIFFIEKSFLMTLSRNEMNHILLLCHNTTLYVILDDDPSKKCIIKEENFPNLRHTLPYMSFHKLVNS